MGLLRLSRRQRLIPGAALCVIILGYFLWFNAYTIVADSERQLVSSPTQPPSIPANSTTTTPSSILLVSAFYPLAKSKHTKAEYRAWLAQFLGNVDADVYFFTTPELAPLVRAARDHMPDSTHRLMINTTYTSPLDIPPLAPHATKYAQMHAWDRERARHAPELYAVWNAKPWFLHEGITNMQQSYKYAFWTDAGSFRHTHAYRTWPDLARVNAVWERAWQRVRGEGAVPRVAKKEDLIFFPVFEVPEWTPALAAWTLDDGPVDLDISEGSFFGSAPATIAWYTDLFYKYHDYYISTPPPPSLAPGHPHANPEDSGNSTYPPFHFVGKDQTLINALFLLHPERFLTVVSPVRAALLPPAAIAPLPGSSPSTAAAAAPQPPSAMAIALAHLARLRVKATLKLWGALRGPAGGPCGDEWFYYQFWLAGKEERAAMRGVWRGEDVESPIRSGAEDEGGGGGGRGGEGQGAWVGAVKWVEGVFRGWGDGERGAGEGRGEKTGCSVMPVVTVGGMLRGVLGAGWEAPRGLGAGTA